VTVHPDTDVAEAIRLLADRIVHLWGLVGSEAERKALLALAESARSVAGRRRDDPALLGKPAY
jgi:hypothetical protein